MSSSTAAPTGTPESKLATLKAAALKAYSQKDYAVSAELYASACELQSTIHGEKNPKTRIYSTSMGARFLKSRSRRAMSSAVSRRTTAPAPRR